MATPRPTPKFMSPLAGPSIPPTSGGTKRKLTAVDENAPASSTAGGGRAKRSAHLLSTTGIGLAHERKVFYGINQAANDAAAEEDTEATYWMVQWRKPQQKKHKTWDGDAILIIRGDKCSLKDTDGKDIGSSKFTAGIIEIGTELRIGGKEIEVDMPISAEEYLSGSCFTSGHKPGAPSSSTMPSAAAAASLARVAGPAFKPLLLKSAVLQAASKNSFKPLTLAAPSRAGGSPSGGAFASSSTVAAAGVEGGVSGTPDVKGNSRAPAPPVKKKPQPKFDPTREGAVVMMRPKQQHLTKYNKDHRKNLELDDIVDVVLDPKLSDQMRPHQKEGVKFMYECVMRLKKFEGEGAILADQMGLGKTLQTVALIWTLLKQTPYIGPHSQSVIGKALIVCPVSLTSNWKKEFNKWLGRDAIGVFVGDGDKNHIRQFTTSRRHQVLVIGYEKLRKVIDELKSCQPPIGLIICDEGHRLKSKDAKTSKMFDALSTKRRIILTGTPVQNDLGEFWSIVEFINPGILDSYSAFNKIYEKPIVKSRAPDCTKHEAELGQARQAKLKEIQNQFLLRRTDKILADFLKAKHEYVVFVAPTTLQLDVLGKLLHPSTLASFIRGPASQALNLIGYARKVCNSPMLLRQNEGGSSEVPAPVAAARKLIPAELGDNDMSVSGKLISVANLLGKIKERTEEKVVLVSNFTQTLNILESHCKKMRYKYERLDGSTPQGKRQDMVDRFNRSPQSSSFIFLLSSKSGGAGINLIGASRLIMFDCDWNPSTDQQAMARVHRDGQKRDVFIYRFMTTGSIDEKIYQRQVTKMGLSGALLGEGNADVLEKSNNNGSDSFSPEELRDLFTVQTRTSCQTHDLIDCKCLYEELEDNDDDGDDRSGPGSVMASGSTTPSARSSVKSSSVAPSDSEDDDEAYITTASNIRPEKAEAKRKKSKIDKLAALKDWTHIDGLAPSTYSGVQDDILRGILTMYQKFYPAPATSAPMASSTQKQKAGASPAPHCPSSSTKRRRGAVVIESDQEEEQGQGEEDNSGSSSDSDSYISVIDDPDFTAPRSPSSSDDERAARRASKKAKKPPQKSILNTIDTIDTIDVLNVHDVEEEEQTQRAMPCFSATSDQTGGWGGVDLASMAAKGEGGRISFLFERSSLPSDSL